MEGGPQERRKVVENVLNWMEEKRKDEGEAVQGCWSDQVDGEGEQNGDQDVMEEDEGMVKTPQILLGLHTELGAGRDDGCNKTGNPWDNYETVEVDERRRWETTENPEEMEEIWIEVKRRTRMQ